MAHIPALVLEQQPAIPGLTLINRGKVRDTYSLDDHPHHLLVVASDRLSIFDFVLPTLVKQKGEVLTAINHFQSTQVLGELFKTDMIACGAHVDDFLPEKLRGNPELQKRATVVRRLGSPDVEDIVRFYLTGSGWKSYQKNRTVGGHRLPGGLINGWKLPFPIYTPSTKAKVGHDLPLTADEVVEKHGFKRERIALQAMQTMANHAETRDLLILDGKLEIWDDVIIDEKGTMDACRYVSRSAYEKAMAHGKLPPSLDKQYARDEGEKLGITNKLEPENPEHLKFVDGVEIPLSVVERTQQIYLETFDTLTGLDLETYQQTQLGIAA